VWSSVSYLFGAGGPPGRAGKLVFDTQVADGATLEDLLRELAADNPRFGRVAYDPRTNEPSAHILVVLNNRLPELLNGYHTQLHEGDRITLVQAYAGG
jgi:sulfur carrier protein ThiS